MKLLFVILTAFAIVNVSLGQDRTLYLDFCENFVSEDNFDIKRIVKNHPERKFQYLVYDYYKNGQLFTSGLAKSKNGKTKDGEFVFYYDNGVKMAAGTIEKDMKKGDWMYWSSNGQEISKDTLIQSISSTNFKSDSLLSIGKCLCYFKEASWIKTNTILSRTVEYEFSDGNQVALNGVYSVTDDTAVYKSGIKEFYTYLLKELKYPLISKLKGKQGKIFVQFIIEKDGKLTDPNFLVSLDEPTERIVKKVLLSTSGKWNPAFYKGRPVSSRLVLPLTFELK